MASQPDLRKTEQAETTRGEPPGPLNFRADPNAQTPIQSQRNRLKETIALLETHIASGTSPIVSPRAGAAIAEAIKLGDTDKTRALLSQYSGMINYRLGDGAMPLHVAVEHGQQKIVEFLLSQKADPNMRNNRGSTPLHLAASGPRDATNLVALLLAARAEVDAQDNEKATPLHAAILKGHHRIVDLLLERGAAVEAPFSSFAITPLFLAASTGQKEIAERLLASQANVHATNLLGVTSLHAALAFGAPTNAAVKPDFKGVVKLLLARGAQVNAKGGGSGLSPLHIAAVTGDREMIELLLANGADVDAKDTEGKTPMYDAALGGRKAAVELLISHKADVNARDHTGRTALDRILVTSDRSEMADLLRMHGATGNVRPGDAVAAAVRAGDLEKLKSLLKDHPALANAMENELYGQTLLHFAAIQGMTSLAAVLLENGADVNMEDRRGRQPLHLAALSFRDPKVLAELLLARGAKINAKGELGATALHEAVKRPNPEFIQFLVSKGADINVKNHNGKTPLDGAAAMGLKENEEVLRKLGATAAPKLAAKPAPKNFPSEVVDRLTAAVQKDDAKKLHELFEANPDWVNAAVRDSDLGWSSLLHLAAGHGATGSVGELLARGGDVHAQNQNQSTPLHKAADAGQKEVVALLLDHQAEINAKGWLGSTPLHLVAGKGHREVVELLVARKAEINVLDDFTRTPLAVAMEENHQEIVELLRKNGGKGKPEPAFVGLIGNGDWTPLHAAAQKGNPEVVRLLLRNKADVKAKDDRFGWTPLHTAAQGGNRETVELLLANGADVHGRDHSNWTPLHLAAERGHKEAIEVLLANRADVNARDRNGTTPLHFASKHGHQDVVELLLANKADVNAKDYPGSTPLLEAIMSGDKGTVSALLAHKADVNVKSRQGKTALQIAKDRGRTEIGELLRQHGAKE